MFFFYHGSWSGIFQVKLPKSSFSCWSESPAKEFSVLLKISTELFLFTREIVEVEGRWNVLHVSYYREPFTGISPLDRLCFNMHGIKLGLESNWVAKLEKWQQWPKYKHARSKSNGERRS